MACNCGSEPRRPLGLLLAWLLVAQISGSWQGISQVQREVDAICVLAACASIEGLCDFGQRRFSQLARAGLLRGFSSLPIVFAGFVVEYLDSNGILQLKRFRYEILAWWRGKKLSLV